MRKPDYEEAVIDNPQEHQPVEEAVEPANLDEQAALPEVQEEVPEVEEPQRPEYPEGRYTVLGADRVRPTVHNSGPAVAYVNERLGLSGDEFTEQTAQAVRQYQEANNLTVTGEVGPGLYESL